MSGSRMIAGFLKISLRSCPQSCPQTTSLPICPSHLGLGDVWRKLPICPARVKATDSKTMTAAFVVEICDTVGQRYGAVECQYLESLPSMGFRSTDRRGGGPDALANLAVSQLIQVVGPLLHHQLAVFQEARPVIGVAMDVTDLVS